MHASFVFIFLSILSFCILISYISVKPFFLFLLGQGCIYNWGLVNFLIARSPRPVRDRACQGKREETEFIVVSGSELSNLIYFYHNITCLNVRHTQPAEPWQRALIPHTCHHVAMHLDERGQIHKVNDHSTIIYLSAKNTIYSAKNTISQSLNCDIFSIMCQIMSRLRVPSHLSLTIQI